MAQKHVYGLYPHELLGASVNGERVGYVNIPGKGYIAISPTGKAYTFKDQGGLDRSSFKPIKLSNYDRQHIFKATQRNGGITAYGTGENAQKVADYWVKQRVPKSTNSIPEVQVTYGGTNGKTDTKGRTSFRDAFKKARAAGLREFTWRGERKNTKIKGEENYTWDANTKRWTNPLASVKQTATDNTAPISVPRERVETPSLDYAANISGLLTNPNPNRYIRTATPTFVGQTNNNWLRDMFRDTFKTFNFG